MLKMPLNYGENSLGMRGEGGKIYPELLHARMQPLGQDVPQPQDADKN